jgi:hypothetical protein
MAKTFEELYEEYCNESLNNIHPILDCVMLNPLTEAQISLCIFMIADVLDKNSTQANAKSDDGQTPLGRIVSNTSIPTEFVELIVPKLIQEGADVNMLSNGGDLGQATPLFLAAAAILKHNIAGNPVIECLVEHGAVVETTKGRYAGMANGIKAHISHYFPKLAQEPKGFAGYETPEAATAAAAKSQESQAAQKQEQDQSELDLLGLVISEE